MPAESVTPSGGEQQNHWQLAGAAVSRAEKARLRRSAAEETLRTEDPWSDATLWRDAQQREPDSRGDQSNAIWQTQPAAQHRHHCGDRQQERAAIEGEFHLYDECGGCADPFQVAVVVDAHHLSAAHSDDRSDRSAGRPAIKYIMRISAFVAPCGVSMSDAKFTRSCKMYSSGFFTRAISSRVGPITTPNPANE